MTDEEFMFEHNDKVILIVGENMYAMNPHATAKIVGKAVEQLIEEARSKKPGDITEDERPQ